MLERDDAGASGRDLGFSRDGQVSAGCEGDDGGDRWGLRVFVVAERAGVQDAIHLLEVVDGCVAEVQLGFLYSLRKFGGVFV